ncbi:MAG: type II toxin-antitoxin system PemK/MazF family toxin [Microcoleus sp.]|uniref:type II toxin-antitoxin system PemK/MazF family toxin n=1 Tax=Microcoleus sp. TaxID=44472 RepID=UPI003C74D3BC
MVGASSVNVTYTRGDVILCDLNPVVGTEQAGIRPVVILQIDRANAVSPHTIIAPFTTKIRRAILPSHIKSSLHRNSKFTVDC